MFDLDLLSTYMVVPIAVLCYIVGIIVKKWVADVDNKLIPTICVVLGVVLSLWIHKWIPTLDVIVRGACSGLVATGGNEMITKLLEKYKGGE